MGKTVRDVINNAPYLLTPQKGKLLEELKKLREMGDTEELVITKDVLKDRMMKVIEIVLYRMLGVSFTSLTSIEKAEIERIIGDIIKEPMPILEKATSPE